jgi:hypothetical protein
MAASAAHSSSPFPSRKRDAPASSGARASTRRPRLARPEKVEEAMRVLTINELMRLTRIELRDLAQRITNELPTFADGSLERANAFTSLRNIRYVLSRRDYSP